MGVVAGETEDQTGSWVGFSSPLDYQPHPGLHPVQEAGPGHAIYPSFTPQQSSHSSAAQ
jgi:hypothetical protein